MKKYNTKKIKNCNKHKINKIFVIIIYLKSLTSYPLPKKTHKLPFVDNIMT